MKKRVLWLLAALVALVCLLTVSAGADGTGQATVCSYDELVKSLADTSLERLIIQGDRIREYDPNTNQYSYKEFAWPEGTSPLTLDLKTANGSTDICIQGTWSIPSHVTVNAHQCVVLQYESPRIVVNGTWNVANVNGYVMGMPGSYYGMVVNGTMTSSLEPFITMTPASNCPLTVNGTMKVPGYCSIQKLTLGDGAVVTGTTADGGIMLGVTTGGTVSCPVGSAVIKGTVREDYMHGSTGFTLDGNMTVDELMLVDSVNVTVSVGSRVTAKAMNQYGAATVLALNGALVLDNDGYYNHTFSGGVINIGSAGELVLMPGNWLDYETSEATVAGSGTIRLYAEYDKAGDSYAGHPDRARVFERYGQTAGDWPSQVANTVAILANWNGGASTDAPEVEIEADVDIERFLTPTFAINTSALTGTDNYAVITVGDKTERVEQAEWADGKITYDGIAMKDLTQTVKLGVYDAEGTLCAEQSVSVYDALKERLDAETDAEKKAEYTAQLHLGAAAQKFFGCNTENLADKDLDSAVGDMSAYRKDESYIGGKDADIIFGTSCVLENVPKMKIYFTDNTKTVFIDGKETELTASATAGYYCCIVDIAPADIFDAVTVEVKDGAETVATAADSVASYCARLYAAGGEENTSLADALLNYGVASKAAEA